MTALLALTFATAVVAGDLTVHEAPSGETRTEVYTALVREDRHHEWDCIDALFKAESGWNPDALGDVELGGSHGLPQRHAPVWGAPPSPWPVTGEGGQVDWTLSYIEDRYQDDACVAWETWLSRSTDGVGGWW